MKTALLVTLVLCASAAFGQAASVSNQPLVYAFESHPGHAVRTPMAAEQRLNGGETYVIAQGERPLWEVAAPPVQEVPLGDSARQLREEHLTGKKAVKCWSN